MTFFHPVIKYTFHNLPHRWQSLLWSPSKQERKCSHCRAMVCSWLVLGSILAILWYNSYAIKLNGRKVSGWVCIFSPQPAVSVVRCLNWMKSYWQNQFKSVCFQACLHVRLLLYCIYKALIQNNLLVIYGNIIYGSISDFLRGVHHSNISNLYVF